MDHSSVGFLVMGSVLGVAAGISPGPLLVLIVSETLKLGRWAGIRISLVPLVSDLPVILISLLVLWKVSASHYILCFISLAGAAYLVVLGARNVLATALDLSPQGSAAAPMLKGVLANLLSPHPYLFWTTVGGPILLRGLDLAPLGGIAFLVGFYSFIVGIKAALAILLARGGRMLSRRAFLATLRGTGIALILMAAWLVVNAVRFGFAPP